ncbi:hypothetical protein PRIPAC_83737 [Pristionchus pacificus]|uniref:Uncharacterized protein n=1 Tax=Pristionchus pacificus TaxID=54126 RepID=A0A2A6BRT4_PRIPA|nr:hypothetical protein PRIPAC_83737 [Pristionchus pacificus]|eukprot:PDM68605.1 hypothetical protein PRIPAC_46907 [Pristionchus pacificus]
MIGILTIVMSVLAAGCFAQITNTSDSLTCDSFANISSESISCYCDERTNDRFTTNGLCRRKGSQNCSAGLIDVSGVCVGTLAILPTTRIHCLSQLMFSTGTCVPNLAYFNSTDHAVFVGSCGVAQRDKQETYCATPVLWGFPNCNHQTGPTEQDWLKLPRVHIVPGNWMPERI